MGDVVPLRKPGICVPLRRLEPQLALMPSAIIKATRSRCALYEDSLRIFLAHNGVLIDPINLVKVSRENLVGATGWVPQESFYQAGTRLALSQISPRVVLELLLQPYLLPDGDYYAAWQGPVRVHVSKRTADNLVVRTESISNLVKNDSAWLWQDKEF